VAKTTSGEVLTGRVRDLSHGGDAVIETDRGIVMARGGLPGERVRVRISHHGGGVARGQLLELVEASPERIEAACDIAARCGGCPLMTLAAAAQLPFKRERLRRALAHHGAALDPELVPSPAMLGYRVRARLGWRGGKHGAEIGYRTAGTASVVDVVRCLVLSPALDHGYRRLRERLGPLLHGRGEIALGLGAGGLCVVKLVSEAAQPAAVYAAAEALVTNAELAGVALSVDDGGAAATWGDPRQLGTGADGQPLWAPAGAFLQANPEVNARLVARVQALAEAQGARVLELYAGHGNFTVALARDAAELRAVEADRDAAEACRQNLLARNLGRVRVVCEDAARGAQGRGPIDVVVLDPPRAGARESLPAILARRPKRIVYVSCDLATLRRDLGALAQAGYEPDAAAAFDMFPQTSHVESVVRLRRRQPS
jgi:23S rRNA (uracil1939-C5)-methyltransferase